MTLMLIAALAIGSPASTSPAAGAGKLIVEVSGFRSAWITGIVLDVAGGAVMVR